MVEGEGETVSQGEVESSLQEENNNEDIPYPELGRQNSIYSLTLDQFQTTLCNSGKNFGSMNMDEFLTSIWHAEENQAMENNNNNHNNPSHLDTASGGLARQTSLARQGSLSLSLPAPLCRKTVEEVWSEIHKGEEANVAAAATRQPTFGEMTLEDFLVKAGVVRDSNNNVIPLQQQQFGVYQSGGTISPNYLNQPGFQTMTPGSSMYDKSNVNYSAPAQVCYSGRVGNGGGTPISPVSSEGIGAAGGGKQVDNGGNQLGIDMGGGVRGKKRIIDGPVEKVVERRQRRMIKNRESAARSRARKQAYTVELEAELNQLKEENIQLKQALVDIERKKKQQYFEELKLKAYSKAQKAREKLRIMRRNVSCPL